MKLVLGETEYDVWDSVNYATLGALDDLQTQSCTTDFEGITDPYIRAAFIRAADLPSGTSLRGQQDFLRALMGIVFLAKRRAGEKVTFAEVREIEYHSAKLRFEPKEMAAETGPKESGAAESPEPT